MGGVGGAVAGGISGGAEGAVEGFFKGALFGALVGIAVASGAGVVAGMLAVGAAGAGVVSLGFLGKAYYHNPSKANGLVLVGAAAGMVAGGLMAKGLMPKTATVYRAQGGTPPNASWRRVNANEEGNINIQGDRSKMLHVSLDDKNHAVYFYNKRGGAAADAEIATFKIPKKLANELRESSVPQRQGSMSSARWLRKVGCSRPERRNSDKLLVRPEAPHLSVARALLSLGSCCPRSTSTCSPDLRSCSALRSGRF